MTALLAVALLLSAIPAVAAAAPPVLPAPTTRSYTLAAPSAAVLAGLTPAQRAMVPTRMTVSTNSITKVRKSATSWCGSYWVTVYSYAAMGMVWWYRMTVPWCWTSGVKITSISAPAIATHIVWAANLGGWEYDGVQNTSQYRLDPTPTRYRTYSQGKFKFCPPRLVCFYSLYPYLAMDVNRLGQGFLIDSGGTAL